jgi:hypothetical protein
MSLSWNGRNDKIDGMRCYAKDVRFGSANRSSGEYRERSEGYSVKLV